MDPAHFVRGSRKRKDEHKEQLHRGMVQAIASAAGCVVGKDEIDQGVDFVISHQIATRHDRRQIDVQLKCTERDITSTGFVVVRLPIERYDEMRLPGKPNPFLLVAQHVVKNEDDWLNFDGEFSEFRVKNYWMNLTGAPERNVKGDEVEVRVPTTQVLDDNALINLFAKVRNGSLPA